MGYNLVLNFLSKGYKTVIYDIDKDHMEELAKEGAVSAESIPVWWTNLTGPG